MGAGDSPATLALAVQVSWPEDPERAEGKLVRELQDEQSVLSTRVKALKVQARGHELCHRCCMYDVDLLVNACVQDVTPGRGYGGAVSGENEST